ncbi:MAG TPA: SPW repeat protein [Vulgatibacter sp.]|nr:SPW repeat protein [Vulgatibacter sp.]
MTPVAARIANIVLGVWLFISAFLWSHTQSQLTNTWIVGLAIIAVALIALAAPPVRYVNTALAVWLFISVWALPSESAATQWNNAIVAILVFLFSLVPEGITTARGPGHRRRAIA